MEKNRPVISILMAVYEPRMDWLREQLVSLNAQTWPNLRLYIRDDCSPTASLEEIRRLAEECVTAFPWTLERNERNLGSNGTFQRLTAEAEGDYFAYCDQDDVWLPEKLDVLMNEMERTGAKLVCSDMLIIDGEGKQTAESMTQVRRHHVFRSGEGLAPGLLISNFVTGCTMLARAAAARAAVPFCPDMVHDHYLALWCAREGSVVSVPRQLIRYRIHSNNQTRVMAGVEDKKSYLEVRVRSLIRRLVWLRERFAEDAALCGEIDRMLVWAQAREANLNGSFSAKKELWRGRAYSPLSSLFELVMAGAPDGLFMLFVKLAKMNAV